MRRVGGVLSTTGVGDVDDMRAIYALVLPQDPAEFLKLVARQLVELHFKIELHVLLLSHAINGCHLARILTRWGA